MLRVIGGEFRGHRIHAPGGRGTRPTRDAVREAWFNALGSEVTGAAVLDLFAGSGALGIEAMSRGAVSCCFVERDRRAAAVLADNLRTLGLESTCRIVRQDAATFLDRRARSDSAAFDLALADPPYDTEDASSLVSRFGSQPFARILCVEHAPGAFETADAAWTRRYGETELSFFVAVEGDANDGS